MSRMRAGSWCLTIVALVPIVLFSSLPASADLVGSDRVSHAAPPSRIPSGCAPGELAAHLGRLSPEERAYFGARPQCVQIVGGITIPEFIGGFVLLAAIAIVALARARSH